MLKKIKYFFIVFLFLFGVLLVIHPALASVSDIERQLSTAAEEGAGYGKPQDPRLTAASIIRTSLQLIGIVFIILIIYAGATWMMAGGNEDQIEKAKKIIKASVIGLIIIICAYGITRLAVFIALGGNRNVISTGTTPPTTQPFNP